MDLELLESLSNSFGPPGYENEPRILLESVLKEDSHKSMIDRLGNVFFRLIGETNKPTIMLAAHLDEVALLITYIDENGFLRFDTLGGIPDRELPGQRFVFKGKNGMIAGVTGTKPPHIMREEERKNVVPREDLFIDIGANSREEAQRKGAHIGMTGVFDVRFQDLGGGYIRGKAFDDRVGCFIMAKAFKALQNSGVNLVAVGTVQEEVGLRGAKTAAWQIYPEYGLALEGTFAADVPGSAPHQISTSIGNGPVITIADRSFIAHPTLLKTLIEVAENESIPFQFKKVPRGGTDAGSIHLVKGGIPSGTVSCPCRYIHGPAAIAKKEDIENTIKLVTFFIKRMSNI